MIRFVKNTIKLCVLLLVICVPLLLSAQTEAGLSLTVTPPLVKINMDPGEIWSSSVKVINTNPESLTIYAQVLDFKSGKEGGVEFIQKKDIQEGESFLLSQWLEVNQGPFEIAAFQSKEVPFSIKVPEDAEPGGHYAAILVGTRPTEKIEGTAIQISFLVASLIMLNVQGEIIEEGRIREFSTEKTFYQKPEVKFTVRFENTGNVHLQPQGEIKIYNFFGKERGTVPINQKTDFGNVLPESIRKWNFEWKGEQSFFDVGRYKAVLVLGFGEEAHQTVSSILYFWVVPLKATLGILGGFFLFLAFTVLAIRAYIKRAVMMAQKKAGLAAPFRPKLKDKVFAGPVAGSVIDLRGMVSKEKAENKIAKPSKIFILKKYLKFALFILIFIFLGGTAYFYLQDVRKPEKSFEVILQKDEEIQGLILPEFEEPESEEPESEEIDKTSLTLEVLNGSGISGAAAKTAILLEKEGFKIETLGNAESFGYKRTIIKYLAGKEKEAEFINQILGGEALLKEVESQSEDIVIIIGSEG